VPRPSADASPVVDAYIPIMPTRRRLGPVVGLFLLAPFVGEFLLGNLTVGELGLVLAPLYGFGALLVRELGRTGLTVTAVLYALGAVLVFWGNYAQERFLASPAQLAGISVVIIGLVVVALGRRSWPLPGVEGSAPSPWLVGGAALVATSAHWGPAVLVTAGWYEWVGVTVWFLVAALGVRLVSRWSRRRGWDQRHRFAL
jgi:hypothetical protein